MRACDISACQVGSWICIRDRLKSERGGTTPKSAAMTAEQQKIQELEAKVNRLEREKSILKKATALLMSDEFNRTL